jgi:hydroxymethylbilane synthase
MRQAEIVKTAIESKWKKLKVELVLFETKGDKLLDQALYEIGEKGLFTRELEEALRSGEIHAAVHSLKDLPVVLPDGFVLAACLERDFVSDALVFPPGVRFFTVESLPAGYRIGTSSLRRKYQILRKNPELEVVNVRGNLQTRIKKLLNGEADALCLAEAGLQRMGLMSDPAIEVCALSERDFLPAVAQGCIGVETADNKEIKKIFKKIDHEPTRMCVELERRFLQDLGGGCSMPLGVFSEIVDGELIFKALLFSEDGSTYITASEATRNFRDLYLSENMITEMKEREWLPVNPEKNG